jgi:hypothetical protein
MEMLSDHPRDDHRVSDLLTHFQQHPETFGKYANNIAKATPLGLPASDQTTTRPQSHYPGQGGQYPPQQGGQYPPQQGGQYPHQPPQAPPSEPPSTD